VFARFQPDPMSTAGLTCRDCHEVEGTTVHRPDSTTCSNCHEPGYWDRQQDARAGIASQLAELRKALGTHPRILGIETMSAFLIGLAHDGTDGAHNPVAAQAALDSVWTIIQKSNNSGK